VASVLFVLKHREDPYGAYGVGLSSGLYNSVTFVVEMLNAIGIAAAMVEVADNNAIDKAVTQYQPTHCILEAFWVVPSKFDVLKPLHPHVQWIVRNHSEIPFLANEGIAMEWITGYLSRGIEIMCNAPRAVADVAGIAAACGFSERLVSYAPNYYPLPPSRSIRPHPAPKSTVKIGGFGAIRPLKNQLAQAVAALEFGVVTHRPVEYHLNATRLEGGGNPILKNIIALFAASKNAKLVQHPWADHAEFLTLMASMDICLQVSFSETFNIVSADAVSQSVPVIASPEVSWLGSYAMADPTDIGSITDAMLDIEFPDQARLYCQWHDLQTYNLASEQAWKARLT